MAVTAIADMMQLNRDGFMNFRNACLRSAKPSRTGNKGPTISRTNFRSCMKEVGLNPTDTDIFEQLFTMWDKNGENNVNLLLFFASISTLASSMDVATKLLFAFEVFDVQTTGRLKQTDAVKILGGINTTASYFGDAVITPQAIEVIVEDTFKDEKEIYYVDYVTTLHHIQQYYNLRMQRVRCDMELERDNILILNFVSSS
jgi:Ca2+-binding EF-hand superfamily protein